MGALGTPSRCAVHALALVCLCLFAEATTTTAGAVVTWSTWESAVVSAVPDDQAQPEATASWMLLLRDSDSGDAGGPTAIGDFNGDKNDDVAYQVLRGPSGAAGTGVLVVFGPEGGSVTVLGGVSYATSGDFNGDGLADVVLQASGRLVLLAGRAGVGKTALSISALGDHNGDRVNDVLVGVLGQTGDGVRAMVLLGPDLSAVSFVTSLSGDTSSSVSALGDVDGDRLSDFGLETHASTERYRTFIVYGSANISRGASVNFDGMGWTAQESYGSGRGANITGIGDINGDGMDDVVIAMAQCGWLRVVLGSADRNRIVAMIVYRRRIIKEVTRWEPRVWHFDESLRPETIGSGKSYALIDAGRRDSEFVVELYQRSPVPGLELARVQIIYSPHQEQAFENRVAQLQARVGNPAFAPGYEGEGNRATRAAVRERLMEMARRTPEAAYPNVKVVAMWHGTRAEALESVFRAGFASLATTDEGFFGKGVYSAYEARYASEVYSRGALLVNWVSLFSAYPVVDGDMPRLTGKGSYANYDAHFIPVRPASAEAGEQNYVACSELSQAVFHELVTFEASQNLPRYLVTLQPSIVQTVPALTGSRAEKECMIRVCWQMAREHRKHIAVLLRYYEGRTAAALQDLAAMVQGSGLEGIPGPEVPQCAVCLEEYAEEGVRCPFVLRCGHSFCGRCVGALATAAQQGPSVRCPTCRELSDVRSDAPRKNYQLAQTVAAIAAWRRRILGPQDPQDTQDLLDTLDTLRPGMPES
eukprot:m51a1_g8939 hypothetical protein (760) ;mRNA; f:935589-941782